MIVLGFSGHVTSGNVGCTTTGSTIFNQRLHAGGAFYPVIALVILAVGNSITLKGWAEIDLWKLS